MDLPELTEDGCNWQTYSSWVLKAISEDGLIGHLDGSETRPTTPKLLQEYGAGWTPRTNEERDVITAWKTADDAWHQRAAMAHQFIIYGLPDSILMLCMHLDTPCKAFAYLEYHYGQIPRPEIQKTVDKAVQQHDMPSEQYMTGESAQSTCDSDNGPENLPGGHEDPADSPNDCAETKSGFLTPKTKVADVQHVEPHLLVVEVGAMDSKWPDEGMDAPEAPDKGSQSTSNKVAESGNLPKLSSEALKPQGDLPDPTSKCTETQTGHRKPKTEVVDMQQVVNVLPMVEVGTTGQTWQDEHMNMLVTPDEKSQPVDSPSERAETRTGHAKPETEVIDTRQVEPHLVVVEAGAVDSEQPDECTNVLEAPDKKCQCVDDEVAACRDLPESTSEALEPTDDMSKLVGGRPTENDPLLSTKHNQRTWTSSETVANVPDPPGTHTELPTLQIKCSILQNEARAQSATNSEIDLSCTRRSDKLQEMKHLELDSERASRHPQRTHRGHSTCETPPDEVWGMGVHMPARVGLGDSTDVRLTATRLEIRDISMQNRPNTA
ncbi:hypothetical protein F5141DRAFT_1218989 [Pisolithus sp. B1]|nr:hypothetical protein F5141DRAFT_1218989 [Pisolithus sp. B1]